jgi:hypothetical protein
MKVFSYRDIRSDVTAKSLGMLGSQKGGEGRVTLSGTQTVGCERQFRFVFSSRREGRTHSYFSVLLQGSTDGNELQGRKLLLLLLLLLVLLLLLGRAVVYWLRHYATNR